MRPDEPETEDVAQERIQSAPPLDTSPLRQPAAQGSGEGDMPPEQVDSVAQVQERLMGLDSVCLDKGIVQTLARRYIGRRGMATRPG